MTHIHRTVRCHSIVHRICLTGILFRNLGCEAVVCIRHLSSGRIIVHNILHHVYKAQRICTKHTTAGVPEKYTRNYHYFVENN